MKKFILMLMIAGTHGYASVRELGFLDFDVGPPARESHNSIQEALGCQSYVPPFTIEQADDKVHHKVHPHDIPDWNILQHDSEFWPVKKCRLIYQRILAHGGITGLYAVLISPEVTAP